MDKETRRIIQEHNLARLVQNNAFKFTDTFFPYTSGEIGPYYVSSEVVQANGLDYYEAISDLKKLITWTIPEEEIEIISGGETRDWVFSLPLALELGTPHFMIYKDGKIKGGTIAEGKNVIHVADLNNQGSSPRDVWVPTIKKHRGKIKDIFFYVDRMEEGVNVMKQLGLESHAVVPLDSNAWDCLIRFDVIEEDVYKNLRERGTSKEQRDAWAIKMLYSDAGIRKFNDLKISAPEKAQKIINHYGLF